MEKTNQKQVWVYGDLRSEKFFNFSLNILAKGRELAGSLGAGTAFVLMGLPEEPQEDGSPKSETEFPVEKATETAMAHGADHVLVLENEGFGRPRADMHGAALAAAAGKRSPLLVMVPLSDFGREVAARAARICGAGLISDCADLQVENGAITAKCPSWGGEVLADISFTGNTATGFATVQTHIAKPVPSRGNPGLRETLRIDDLEIPEGLTLLSRAAEPGDKRKLEEAEIVVAGGAGLGSMDAFGHVRDLAAVLGGELGATRPPVLLHWVEEDRLIGQTGKHPRPKLLFSVGTSGAVQYTVGIEQAGTIVAVNRDETAPIFRSADIGVVADARTFLPVLTDKLKRVTMRKLADVLAGETAAPGRESFGARVRKLRESQGWSQEKLAESLGQPPEFIAQVERDETTPSVSFLLRLAGAMKIDPGLFLGREEQSRIKDMRQQAFTKRTQNYSYQTLSPGAESDHLRAFMISIEPQQAHKPVAYKHDGEEFIFVMDGDLKLTLDNKAHHLKPGESIHFNSTIPHKLKSTSNETTRCLVILYTP